MMMLPIVLALMLPQSPQTTPTFLESLDVRITNVDVVVTDKRGHTVRGLGRNDFVVLENGTPQTITNFAEYSGSTGSAETMAAPAAAPATEAITAPPPRKFLFFIDDMSLTDRNQKQLIESATTLIREQMRPGDEAMVITRAQTADVKPQFPPAPPTRPLHVARPARRGAPPPRGGQGSPCRCAACTPRARTAASRGTCGPPA